jgi:hypothetical protein
LIKASFAMYNKPFSVHALLNFGSALRLVCGGLACAALACAGLACGPDALELPPVAPVTHQVEFVGGVYDAASGQRLTEYAIEVMVRDEASPGSITSSTGRFLLGPVSAFDDYSVYIPLKGYREFWSHNGRIGLPAGVTDGVNSTSQTRYFDAYLFPSDLQTAAVQFTINTPVAGELTAGVFRMRPTGVSSLSDTETETPAGVAGQVWHNDEDLLAGAITTSFKDSLVKFDAGELVYGVQYQIDVFGVAGYQPLTISYTAGIDTDKTLVLVPEIADALALVMSNADTCTRPNSPDDTESAVVVLEMNYDIENADLGNAELLDDNLSIINDNVDMDGFANELNEDMSETELERGTSFLYTGAKLTFKFSPKDGLAEQDLGDTITQVRYAGLDSFFVQRKGKPTTKVALSSLLGQSMITCDDTP